MSVTMITAVLVAMTSFFSLFGDITAYTDGNYIFRISDATQQEIESVKNDSRVSDIGFGADGSGYRIKERKSNAKGIGTVYLCDDEEYKMLVTAKYDGTLPQNENEIAVEEELITKNNLSWKIGDTVTLEVGQRISTKQTATAIQFHTSRQASTKPAKNLRVQPKSSLKSLRFCTTIFRPHNTVLFRS